VSYVRTRLGRLFYEERGAGRVAFVLQHSFLFDGRMWRPQVAALAELGRVLVVDGPGHGKSEVPPPFELEEHAAAMFDALDAWRVERAVLCGLSWGGMVSMRMAFAQPQRVAGLALLDTSARAEPLKRRARYRAMVPLLRAFGMPRWFVAREVAPKMYGATALAERPSLVDDLTRGVNAHPRDGVAEAAMAIMMKRRDVSERLASIRAPTLVLCGREDRATRPAESEHIARAVPGAKLVLVDRCGHISTLERPDEVTRALVDFGRDVLAREREAAPRSS